MLGLYRTGSFTLCSQGFCWCFGRTHWLRLQADSTGLGGRVRLLCLLTDQDLLKFSSWANQEIPQFLLNMSFLLSVQLSFFLMLCQISPFHKKSSNFYKFQWNLILSSVLSSSKWSVCFELILQKPICIYAIFRLFHTPHPLSSSVFHQPNVFGEQHTSRSSLLCNFC